MAEKTIGVFDSAAGGKSFVKKITPFLYLFPAFLVMGVITFYPMGYQVWMSFTDYGIKNIRVDAPLPDLVGFKNYINILTTNLGLSSFNFWRTLAFNLWWTFSNVISSPKTIAGETPSRSQVIRSANSGVDSFISRTE